MASACELAVDFEELGELLLALMVEEGTRCKQEGREHAQRARLGTNGL